MSDHVFVKKSWTQEEQNRIISDYAALDVKYSGKENTYPADSSIMHVWKRLVYAAGIIENIKPLLIADVLLGKHGKSRGCTGLIELQSMINRSEYSRPYATVMKAWFNNELGVAALGYLFLEDKSVYTIQNWIKKKSHRIDVLAEASFLANKHEVLLNQMDDIQQLAVKHGCRFSAVAGDKGKSLSLAWCIGLRESMDSEDQNRLDAALVEQISEKIPTPEI